MVNVYLYQCSKERAVCQRMYHADCTSFDLTDDRMCGEFIQIANILDDNYLRL